MSIPWYLILSFSDSFDNLVRILGQISPSYLCTLDLFLDHLFIIYKCISSNIEIIGLDLASTITLLKASLMLFTNVSQLACMVNLDLDQYLKKQIC